MGVWVRGAGAQSAAAHGAAMLGVGAGGGRPLPQRGSGGYNPRKNLGILHAKSQILVHILVKLFTYFADFYS
jgi:hypothetical protein